MNIADLFINDPWEEFDKLPIPLQAFELRQKKKEYKLYLKRFRRNCGKVGGGNKKHSTENLAFIIDEMERIRIEHETSRKKPEMSLTDAYIALVRKALDDPETEDLFLKNDWLSPYKLQREKEIRRLAKNFQQSAYRYRKKMAGT